MNNSIRNVLVTIITSPSICSITRRLTNSYLRILVFHKIYEPDDKSSKDFNTLHFERYLQYLKKYYHVYHLSDLIDRHLKGLPLNKPAAAITFDDGHLGFYLRAYPLLKKYQIPATLYVVPSFIDGNDWLWFDKLNFLVSKNPDFPLFSNFELPGLISQLTKISVSACESRIIGLAETLRCKIPPEPPVEEFRLANWDQLREMSESGLVDIGAHTVSHQVLSAVDPDIAQMEISLSSEIIQKYIGIKPKTFCYPNGLEDDYNPSHFEMLKNEGYLCSVSSHYGFANKDSNIFALPRVHTKTDFKDAKKYLDGFHYLQHCKM